MNKTYQAYWNSPAFKALVEVIFHQMVTLQYSATEVREAAVMAAIRYEQEIKLPDWKKEIGILP